MKTMMMRMMTIMVLMKDGVGPPVAGAREGAWASPLGRRLFSGSALGAALFGKEIEIA